jgi:hypothetical protein
MVSTGAAVTVTPAFPLAVGLATLVAVTEWLPGWDGAVYKPAALIVPTVEFPPAAPSTDQATAVFEAFCTLALN